MFNFIRRLFGRKNPVYETMTKFTYGHTYRVWREENSPSFGPDPEVLALIERLTRQMALWQTILKEVGKLPRIAAVEILDKDGNGGLFYPDWK